MYELRILDGAEREIARLDKSVGQFIVRRLHWLAVNLDAMRPEALKGNLAGLYKFRAGDYRVIYEILREESVIVIHAVGNRREIYRRH